MSVYGYGKMKRVKCGNWSFSQQTINLLKKVSKRSGKSQSWLVEQAIIKNYYDPIERLKVENKELALKINKNQDEIKRLESLSEDSNKND